MFTGIIEKTGELAGRIINKDGSGKIELICKNWDSELLKGESIAVNGACLSLESSKKKGEKVSLSFSVLKETLDKTTLGILKTASVLNLERALRADSRIGGHFVSGHIDATADILSTEKSGRDWMLEVQPPKELLRQMVSKGSVAVDGVSLTIAELSERSFTVFLIPLTISETSLGSLRAGSKVNIETDIIGKYVCRRLENYTNRKIDMEFLKKAGF